MSAMAPRYVIAARRVAKERNLVKLGGWTQDAAGLADLGGELEWLPTGKGGEQELWTSIEDLRRWKTLSKLLNRKKK